MARKRQQSGLVAGVAEFAAQRRLLREGAGIVVAVSGGADSVALLEALCELAPANGYRLTVAHFNHKLRSDADADEQFVRDLARRHRLPFVSQRRDVAAAARRHKTSVEQAARTLRYEFLVRAARRAKARYVAVGHHADDNVETLVHRIFRGTGLAGLRGIPAKRVLSAQAGGRPKSRAGEANVYLVRPLLECRRQQIEIFLRERGLAWCSDVTNLQTEYRRNFIRHRLLPSARAKLNPKADEAILRLSQIAAVADAFMQRQARRLLKIAMLSSGQPVMPPAVGVLLVLDAATLAAADPALLPVALQRMLQRAGVAMCDVSAGKLTMLAKAISQRASLTMTLAGSVRVRVSPSRVTVAQVIAPKAASEFSIPLSVPGEATLPDGRVVTAEEVPSDKQQFREHLRARQGASPSQPYAEYLDADALQAPLTVRTRRRGDVFDPLGAPGRQSVSDFLTNLKHPRREQVVCVCDERGIVVVAPLRIADRAKVTARTGRMVRITLGNSH